MTCLDLPAGLRVLLLNRNTGRRSSSRWAQGGIAAVTRPEDNASSHAEDTIHAGAGLCDGDAVRLLVDEAPHCVERLQREGPLTEMGPTSPQHWRRPTAINGSYTYKTKPDALWWMCCGNASKNGKDCCTAVVFASPN